MILAVFMKMRQRVGLLIGIIGVAIVSFLLMDALNSSTNLMGNQDQNLVGTIEGEEVDAREFEDYYQYVRSRVNYFNGLWANPDFSFSDEQVFQIRNSAWNQYIINQVVKEHTEELGITVTEQEVENRIFSRQPMREVQNFYSQVYPNAQTEGYNPQTMRQLVQQIESFGVQSNRQQQAIQEYYRVLKRHVSEQLLRSKFNNLFSKSVIVPEWEAEQAYVNNNRTFDISYLSQPYTSVSSEEIEVDDPDLKKYLSSNESKFDAKPSIGLKYVIFNILPTKRDSMTALNFVKEKLGEIKQQGRDSIYVKSYSETEYNRGYHPKDEILTKMADSLFKVDEGTFIGPYLEDGKYRVAKLMDRTTLPDSVKVRTIFISRNQYSTQDSVQLMIDTVKSQYEAGVPFDSLAMQYSSDQQSAAQGGDLGWFKPSNNTLPWDMYNNIFFKNGLNDTFTTNTPNGMNFMQITAQGEETEMAKYYILDRSISPGPRTRDSVYAIASAFASQYANADSFDVGIEKYDLIPREATAGVNEFQLPGINVSSREIIRWAFNDAKPKAVKLFRSFEATDDKYVIAQLQNRNKGESRSVDAFRNELATEVQREKKAQILKDRFADAMQGASSIEEIANNLENGSVKQANGITFNAQTIPGIGNEPAVAGTGAGLAVGSLSQPVEGNQGVYVIQKSNESDITVPEDLTVQKNQIGSRLSTQFGNQLLQHIQEGADTEDKRYNYY